MLLSALASPRRARQRPVAFAVALIAGLVATALAAPAWAQHAVAAQPNTSLSTWGIGTVEAIPDEVVMVTTISAEAELAEDAIVKFRDAKRRATEALEGLKIENLEVEGDGMSLNFGYSQQQINMLQRGQGANITPSIIAQEKLLLRVGKIDKLETPKLAEMLVKLVDAAQDIGLSIGGMDPQTMRNYGYSNQPTSLFVFKVSDTESLITEARKEAIADAKKRAAGLASEAEVKLGQLTHISEQVMNQQNRYGYRHNGYNQMMVQAVVGSMQSDGSGPMASTEHGKMRFDVRVSVTYQITPME